ncbi:MAG: hypothetical protein QOJ63_155 [Solirubrobacteraceae bacterium]|nr:hypothetical protein [Solirubrobacteraceae bacterium]
MYLAGPVGAQLNMNVRAPVRHLHLQSDAGACDDPAAQPGAPNEPPDQLTTLMARVLRADWALNFLLRGCLALVAVAASVLALLYVARHEREIVAAVDSSHEPAAAVLAATLPVALFLLLGAFTGAFSWAVHVRGADELYRMIDTVSRMEREGEVAVSARGLIHAFEEKLQNTRRAFTLLLWLGRTMFVVCLGLFAAALINAMLGGQQLVTVVLGASSVVGALLAVVRAVPQNIAHHLADVIQIQSIITGCDRQISLLESAAFDAVNRGGDAAEARDAVLDLQRRMDQVVGNAVRRIERYAVHEGDA